MRVLVASAKDELAERLRTVLVDAGMVCDIAPDPDEDLACGGLDYDCLVLDLDRIGLEPLRRVRAAQPLLPIITVQHASESWRAATAALVAGADDFLPKPFAAAELIARIRTRIIRAQGHTGPSHTIAVGPLVIDPGHRIATLDGRDLRLTAHEYALVEALALANGRVVPKVTLMGQLYHVDDEPNVKILSVFVCKVRRKLRPWEKLIETSWGRGYALRLPTEPAAPRFAA